MRKLLISIMFLFGGALTMVSAQDMRTVFLNAPDGIFPLLSGNDRADLVDYIEAGMTAKVTNRLDGTTVLHELEADYLKLATTASSDVQLKLLPFQGDTVICMIKTVKAEAAVDAANLRSVMGQLNGLLASTNRMTAAEAQCLVTSDSKMFPEAKMLVVYQLPGFIDAYYYVDGQYYGLKYFSAIAQGGMEAADGISTAKPTGTGYEWYEAGVGAFTETP